MAKAKQYLLRASPPVTFSSPANAWVYVNRRLYGDTKAIAFNAPVNTFTGFGQVAQTFAEGLAKDYHVSVRSLAMDTSFGKLPVKYASLVKARDRAKWEIRVQAVDAHYPVTRPFVLYTMWESSVLRPEWVDYFNKALAVFVPTVWNADTFSAAGVRVPIKVVPLGVAPAKFPYAPMQMHGPCVFGIGGKTASGGSRKGLNETMDVFRQTFPESKFPDVRLRVKCFPSCDVREPEDSRIEVIRRYFTPKQLREWYASLTAYISGASAGGWELMPHQALLTGRPVIGTNYGGISAYFDSSYCYPVTYRLAPATGFYKGLGHWAQADNESLQTALRSVYFNRKTAQHKGREGAKAMKRFTDADSVASMREALSELGLL